MKSTTVLVLATALAGSTAAATHSRDASELNDLEMAHVAVTANDSDIAYAHLALALSDHPGVRAFAETMIRDHSAVTDQVAALADRLGVMAQDNEVSQQLRANKAKTLDELSRLRGDEFDRRYSASEAAYHGVVNKLVAEEFIPNIENPEVKQAFQAALDIFLVHQRHAEQLEQELAEMR